MEAAPQLPPAPAHLPEAVTLVGKYCESPEGLAHLRDWINKSPALTADTKVHFLWSMGVTDGVVRQLPGISEGELRAPPTPMETQALLLITSMTRGAPKGHQFFRDLETAGGVTVLLDHIDRLNGLLPDRLLYNVVHALVNIAWKGEDSAAVVPTALLGNPRLRFNLVCLVTYVVFEKLKDTSAVFPVETPAAGTSNHSAVSLRTTAHFLQNILLLVYSAVNAMTPGSLTLEEVGEMVTVLEFVWMSAQVEVNVPRALTYLSRIFRGLFEGVEDTERREKVIDLMVERTLLDRLVQLVGLSSSLEVKVGVVDLLLGVMRRGSGEQRRAVLDSGVAVYGKQLLRVGDPELGTKVIDLLGLLADVDPAFNVVAAVFGDPEVVPMLVEHVNRVFGGAGEVAEGEGDVVQGEGEVAEGEATEEGQ